MTLGCSASGGNDVTYTWINPNGIVIATDNSTRVYVSTEEDYGAYLCIAANSVGEDNATINVLRLGMNTL